MTGSPPRTEVDARDPWSRPPTLRERVVSGFLWTVGLAWLVGMMSLMMVVGLVLPADRTDWLNRLYCRGQVALTGARWRAVVAPEIDPDQPYIFACNHVNLLDHVTMYPATPHFKQGIELERHFRIPFYGWFMRQRGTLPVLEGSPRRSLEVLREGVQRELERGHSILVFPEGHRTRDGRVQRFRRGIFQIAIELGVPIVPTTVTGMYEILRADSARFRRGGEVTVFCDTPVRTEGLSARDAADLARRVQAIVATRVEEHHGWR